MSINRSASKDVQLFTHPVFGQLRIKDTSGDEWFVAVDVCKILGLSNPTEAVRNLDDDERSTLSITEGQKCRTVNIISESGLYALIMKSRKPEAKKFRKWVTSEVLPSLRKTGSYSAPSEPTTQPQFSTMGERVKYLWQRSEFHTIAELERKADISRDVIRRLIGGHSITLSSMNLVRVAKALGVRPEVLTGTEPMPELPERGANNPSVFGLGLGWFLQMSSHVDIAKMEEGLNLPHGMVGDILSGHIQTPDLKTALKIAQYLNISPYVLAGMEYPKAPYRDGADELERMKVHIRNLQHIVANRLHVPLTSLTDCGLYGHNMADYHNHVILPHRIQNPDSGEEYPPF